MREWKHVIVALVVSGFVASCFSGSSTQGTTTRKAPKRLGESATSEAPAQATAATTQTTPATADNTSVATGGTAGDKTLRTLYVNVAGANVRSMPSTDATVVAKLKFLDPVGATGALDGEWVQVEVTMSDGAIGKAWIHSRLVSASKEQAEAVKAAADGK